MFRSVIAAGIGTFLATGALAQPTWADDVAEIIYTRCAHCHHNGGIAPFPLMSFNDALMNGASIHHVVSNDEMPPWPADPNYRHFMDEDVLSTGEKSDILDWITGGFPQGNMANAPAPPTFLPSGSLLDTIHHTVAIDPYTLQSNVDEYRWFVVPTNFPDTVYISRIEVTPGLPQVVHHADLSYDLTGQSAANDAMDPLPGFNGSTGGPTYSHYINAWQPGGNIATYPEGWGVAVPPGADFVVEVHYGPGGFGQIDSTIMNLEFVTNTQNVRPVSVGWLLYDSPPVLLDGPLVIPANQVVSFHQQSAPLTQDLSLVAICPHMHFLGKSYKVWAVTPTGDTIRLVDVPQWDLHWQKYYTFQQIQHLPAGTVMYSEGWYDNTTNNHDNPNSPPQTVYQGPRTEDEMFLCYFIYANYEPGDENIIMDSSVLYLGLQGQESLVLSLYPNPTSDRLFLKAEKSLDHPVIYQILGMDGRLVGRGTKQPVNGDSGVELDVGTLPEGMYLLNWNIGPHTGSMPFVKH